jgi:hypothetical protein
MTGTLRKARRLNANTQQRDQRLFLVVGEVIEHGSYQTLLEPKAHISLR